MLRHRRREPDFLWGTAPHMLDALCHVAGPLELPEGGAVAVPGATRCNRVGRLCGPADIAVTFEILPDCGRVDERLTLAGAGFHVEVSTGSAAAWQVEAWRDGALEWSRAAGPGDPEFLRNGAYGEMKAFLDNLRSRRPLMPGVEDALHATRLAEALDRMTPGFVEA
jgi:predicted dehydrogenase